MSGNLVESRLESATTPTTTADTATTRPMTAMAVVNEPGTSLMVMSPSSGTADGSSSTPF